MHTRIYGCSIRGMKIADHWATGPLMQSRIHVNLVPDTDRQIRNLWFAVWLMLIAICTIALLWQITQLRPTVLEARSFSLIDESGTARATLKLVHGQVAIAIWDSEGMRVLWIPDVESAPVALPAPHGVGSPIERDRAEPVVISMEAELYPPGDSP
jgi:hypothetical protein